MLRPKHEHCTTVLALPVDKGTDVLLVDLLAVAVGEKGIQVTARTPIHVLLQQQGTSSIKLSLAAEFSHAVGMYQLVMQCRGCPRAPVW